VKVTATDPAKAKSTATQPFNQTLGKLYPKGCPRNWYSWETAQSARHLDVCQMTPTALKLPRKASTTSARAIASSRFFFRNAFHWVCLVASATKTSANPTRTAVGMGILRRSKVAQWRGVFLLDQACCRPVALTGRSSLSSGCWSCPAGLRRETFRPRPCTLDRRATVTPENHLATPGS
jgi:hypothetical protein